MDAHDPVVTDDHGLTPDEHDDLADERADDVASRPPDDLPVEHERATADVAPPPSPGATRPWWAAMVVAAAVVAGAVSGGVAGRLTADRAEQPGATPSGIVQPGPGDNSIQAVLARVEPAVVSIRTQAYRRGAFFPSEGAGSGTVLTPDGEVLTNAHVVEGATSIEVTLDGEDKARVADLVGADRSSDIALLKIRGASGLRTATLGQSSALRVGDPVIAIGNALDLGATPTVTEGIVSALNRSIEDRTLALSGLIQTDAAINPGNSGGPLVDLQGRVVGVNTAIAGDAQNIGFALAIDMVKPVIEDLRAGRGAVGGGAFLGVGLADAPSDGGAVVTDTVPGGPAATAGIVAGDVITRLGDTEISSSTALARALRSRRPGDVVRITLRRGTNVREVSVTLGARPG